MAHPPHAGKVVEDMSYGFERSAVEVHDHLLELRVERTLAVIDGLAVDSAYIADLDGEIEATTSAYVGAAVTEIATLRAELSGPQVG
jgi:hypothetical protein